MVRSPQLIVCAEVTAGSCADVAVTVSDAPIVATVPLPRSLQPTPVPWSRKFCRSNTNGAPARSTTACSRHAGERIQPRAAAIADDDLVAAVILGINSQDGQRHWACRRDLHVGVGPARGADADHPIAVAVAAAKLPDPQRGRAVAAVEIGDRPLRRAGRGRGAARRAACRCPGRRCDARPGGPTPTTRPGADVAFPGTKSGRSGRRRIVRPAPRTPRGDRP